MDGEILLDLVVAALRSNPDVTAIVPNVIIDWGNNFFLQAIRAYYSDFSGSGVNREQQIIEQPAPSILCCYVGTRTGNFAKAESIKHDFILYLKPAGRPSPLFVAIREGVCTSFSGTMKFKLSQLHPQVNPPADMNYQIVPRIVTQEYGVFDSAEVTFTLIERGLDI